RPGCRRRARAAAAGPRARPRGRRAGTPGWAGSSPSSRVLTGRSVVLALHGHLPGQHRPTPGTVREGEGPTEPVGARPEVAQSALVAVGRETAPVVDDREAH